MNWKTFDKLFENNTSYVYSNYYSCFITYYFCQTMLYIILFCIFVSHADEYSKLTNSLLFSKLLIMILSLIVNCLCVSLSTIERTHIINAYHLVNISYLLSSIQLAFTLTIYTDTELDNDYFIAYMTIMTMFESINFITYTINYVISLVITYKQYKLPINTQLI